MANRGGLWINIAGGVDPNTIKSLRVFAKSLSEVGYAARGLEKAQPSKGLDASISRIKKFHNSVINSINGIISGVDRYAQSAQRLRISLKSDASKFKVLGNAITGATGSNQTFTRSIQRLHPALQKASLSLSAYQKNMQRLNRGFVGYVDSSNRFVSQTDKVTRGVSRSRQELGMFGRALEYVGHRTRQFAAFTVAAVAVQGFTRALTEGIRVIAQYDQSLQNLQAIVNITASQSNVLGDVIQDVSRRTKFSAQEVADGMQTLGQAGLDMNESMAAISGVARLATGTMSNFQTVSDLVTTTLNAFNLAATESTRIADVFANAINNSKLSVDKLGTAFNYVGAAGNQVGLTLNEVSGTLMTLADNGLRASTMGTGLRRMMLKMLDASTELQAALSATGKDVDALNPKIVGWEQALQNLVPLLWDAQRETVDMAKATDYFGTRAAQVAAVLVRNAANGSDALSKAIGQTKQFGAAARMAETQIEGLQLSFKNLQDRIKLVAVAIGEAGVTDALKILVDTLSLTASAIEKFVKAFGASGAATGASAVGVLSLFSIGIAKVVSWLFKLRIAVQASTAIIGGFNAAIGSAITAIISYRVTISSAAAATSGWISATNAAIAALRGFKAVLGTLFTGFNALVVAISGAVVLLYKYINAHNEAAKAASKHAQELAATGKAMQEWGKSLKDAFGTSNWDDTVRRFEEVEIAGNNLSEMLEKKLEKPLEEIPFKGEQGFKDLEEAINSVTFDQFEKQMETSVEQINHVIKSAGRMRLVAGTEIPKDLQQAQQESTRFGKALNYVAGAFAKFNKSVGLKPLQDLSKTVVEYFGPDKQEMLDNYKDGVFNLVNTLENMAEVGDWTITDAVKGTQEAIDQLNKTIEGDASPAINRLISDMTARWGSRAVREFEVVTDRVGELRSQLRSGQITVEEFVDRYSRMSIDSIIPEEELQNIESTKEAFDLLDGTAQKLRVRKEELKEQVELLFREEKTLEQVIEYVNEDMNLSEKMAEKLTNALKDLKVATQDSVMAFNVFMQKLGDLGPEATSAFRNLRDAQKAELKANYEDIQEAGNELKSMYESALGMSLEEAAKNMDSEEINKKLMPFDVKNLAEAHEEVRKKQLNALDEMLKDMKDEADDNDIYEEMLQKVSNAEKQALLEVEKGSIEALRIQKEYAQKELEVARKRYEDDPTAENYGKILSAKHDYRDQLLDIEEKITEDMINESERRIEERERILEKEEAQIQGRVLSGEITEEQADVQIAEKNLRLEKERLSSKKKLISELREEGAKEKEIREIIEEKEDAVISSIEAQNELTEARQDQIEAQIDREEELAQVKRESALAGIEEDNKRFEIQKSNREGIYALIEQEHKVNYESAQKKLAAEQNYLESMKQVYNDRLAFIKKIYTEESNEYRMLQYKKEAFVRETQTNILRLEKEAKEARIRAEGSLWEKTKLGLDEFTEQYKEDSKTWSEYTADAAKVAKDSWNDAFADFILGTKSASDAFKSFGKAILKEMADILAKSVTKQFLGMFMGMFGGGGLSSSTPQNPSMGADVSPFAMAGVGHSGIVVGKEFDSLRLVSSSLFDGARKLHDGLKSLSSNEYPAILKKGEVVFTENQLGALAKSLQIQRNDEKISREGMNPNFEVNVINKSGENVDASKSEPKWNGEKFVMNVVLDAANRNKGNFGKNLKSALSKS